MGKHNATIVLRDLRVGEMEYNIEGKGLLPDPVALPIELRNLDNLTPVVLRCPFENS